MYTYTSCIFIFLLTGWYFAALDNVFLGIYIVEIVLKLYVFRKHFFSDGWNVLGKNKNRHASTNISPSLFINYISLLTLFKDFYYNLYCKTTASRRNAKEWTVLALLNP